jgi:hypothetical protein
MKKITLTALVAGTLFYSCVSYKGVGQMMDGQTLPTLTSVSKPASVAVTVETGSDLMGVPDKGTIQKKSGYLVPLPFVGFFGKHLTLQPGETSLENSLQSNLATSLENELAAAKLTLTEDYNLNVKVDSTNFNFKYNNKGYLVWIFIIQFGGKKEWCTPNNMAITTTYELKKGDVVVKKGTVTNSSQNTEKITATSQPGLADPYAPGDMNHSPTQQAVAGQYAFAFGGAASTISNGLNQGFTDYNKLIIDTSRDIVKQITPSLK